MSWEDVPCKLWPRTDRLGYGVRKARRLGFTTVLRHVQAWVEANGPVPEGLEIHHRCRVKACYEAEHLQALTHAENCAEDPPFVVAVWRTGRCQRDHVLNEETIYVSPRGQRRCKVCRLLIQREYHARRRAESFALSTCR